MRKFQVAFWCYFRDRNNKTHQPIADTEFESVDYKPTGNFAKEGLFQPTEVNSVSLCLGSPCCVFPPTDATRKVVTLADVAIPVLLLSFTFLRTDKPQLCNAQ